MKQTKSILLAAMIALTGSVAFNTAHAAPLSYSAGNIFIGFRATGGTGADKSYLLNLGNFADLTILKGGDTPVQLFSLSSQLSTIFGSDWYTRGDVQWGIFGMPDNKSVVYSSTADEGNAPAKKAAGALATTYSNYSTMGSGYNSTIANGTYDGSTVTTGVLGEGVVTGAGSGTWAANTAAATDFGVYSATLEAGVSTNLELWGVTASTQTKYTQYDLSSGGSLSVVPEPTTYALMGLGALLLIVAHRRKTAA
jgi:hypothetical protein